MVWNFFSERIIGVCKDVVLKCSFVGNFGKSVGELVVFIKDLSYYYDLFVVEIFFGYDDMKI